MPLNGHYPLPDLIGKRGKCDPSHALPICAATGIAREHHFAVQNGRFAILKLFAVQPRPKPYLFSIRNQFSSPEVYTKLHLLSSRNRYKRNMHRHSINYLNS